MEIAKNENAILWRFLWIPRLRWHLFSFGYSVILRFELYSNRSWEPPACHFDIIWRYDDATRHAYAT
jgi:hypothetical protein